ncbi:hypothetical protein ES705_40943 [subsurface metagenome]
MGIYITPTETITNTMHPSTTKLNQYWKEKLDVIEERILKRINTIVSSATPTPNIDTTDIFTVTALAEDAVFGAPTGTPINCQPLLIRIKDNGTARALDYNVIYRAGDIALPTTTIIGKTMYLG